MAAVQQQTTQLEFHQAMADFKTMFPEMDDDVIEAVLRANQGAVDATIDQLLAMSTDNENEKLRNEIEQHEKQQQPPLIVTTSPSLPTIEETDSCTDTPSKESEPKTSPVNQKADVPLRTVHGWNPPLLGALPEDFLRISPAQWTTQKKTFILSHQMLQQKYAENQQCRGALGEVGDPDLTRYLEDERIALFLQNEEFMQELRRNKDFLSTLEKDQPHDAESPPEEAMGAFPFTKTLSGSHDDDALFKERLRNMGKVSRKKFAQLARVFTRRKKRSAKQILSQGPAPSHDNLLLNAEPLLDDDEDDDLRDEVEGRKQEDSKE